MPWTVRNWRQQSFKKQLYQKWSATVHIWTALWFKLLKRQMTISFIDHVISVIYTCIRKFCRIFRLDAPTLCSNIRCSLIQRVYSQCCCALLCVALQPNRTWFASFLSFRNYIQLDTRTHLNSSKRIIISSQRTLSTQYTTNTWDKHPFPQRYSNPWSQQSSWCRPILQTARQPGSPAAPLK